MRNKYFDDEFVSENDLLFICYMTERVARKIKQKNKYVINSIGYEQLYHLISVANVLHSVNPNQIEDEWIETYGLSAGNFDITEVDPSLCETIPTPMDMGKVYTRLIMDTLQKDENYISGCIRVYNHAICETLDNYNASAYYEPSYVIAKAYLEGEF